MWVCLCLCRFIFSNKKNIHDLPAKFNELPTRRLPIQSHSGWHADHQSILTLLFSLFHKCAIIVFHVVVFFLAIISFTSIRIKNYHFGNKVQSTCLLLIPPFLFQRLPADQLWFRITNNWKLFGGRIAVPPSPEQQRIGLLSWAKRSIIISSSSVK